MKYFKINNLTLFIVLFIAFTSLVLYSCKEEDPLEVTGNVSGSVIDKETSKAIPSVSVSLTSTSNSDFEAQSKVTGDDGEFSFPNIAEGSYRLSFMKKGYKDNSQTITVKAGSTSTADIQLLMIHAQLELSVTQLDFGEDNNNLPLEISNSGEGVLTWSIVEDLEWLSASPGSGDITTGKTSVTITVDRSKLPEGVSSGTVVFNSNGGSKTLTIVIGKPQPILKVTPESIDFGDTEIEKSLSISNIGIGVIAYTASAPQSWITLEGASGNVTTDEIKTIKVKLIKTGLTPGDYSGAIVINSNNNSVEVPVAMKVIQASEPSVLNGSASGIKNNEAQVSGNINNVGSSAITQHGHCWSTSPNPSTSNNKTTLGGTNTEGAFSSTLNGLSPSTTYYVKAYATNEVGTAYSDEITFTTLAPPTVATVTTGSAIEVRYNEADINGNITTLGDGLVTDYGFCYSASNANPTTADSKISLGQTTNVGSFEGTITGLNALSTYYVRAYAINSMGTAYGTMVKITTSATPPLVTNGLMAYWTFDNKDAGDLQGDYKGINFGVTYDSDIPNNNGYSAKFNGISDYIQLASNPLSGLSSFSFNFWSKSTVSGIKVIFHQGDSYYDSGVCFSNDKVGYSFYDGLSGYFFNTNISSLISSTKWEMITVTVNSTNASLYINGVLIESISNPSKSTGGNMAYIGRRKDNYRPNYFSGHLDNLRIYNRVLTQSEITELFNAKQ